MSSLSFTIFCGRCFRTISQNSTSGGSVLSCGDFLCSNCAQSLISGSACPACGKHGVRAAFLNDSLPEEVRQNISDATKEMEKLHSAMMFQVKYYKQLIKRLLSRIQQMEQENQKKGSIIKDLETRLASTTRTTVQQPFFSRESEYVEDDTSSVANQAVVVSNFGPLPPPQNQRPPSTSAYFSKRHEVNSTIPQGRVAPPAFLASRSSDPLLVPNRRRVPTPTNAFHIDIDSRPTSARSKQQSPLPNIRTATEAFLQPKTKSSGTAVAHHPQRSTDSPISSFLRRQKQY